MPNSWLRLYAEFATDPKVQMLSEEDQRRLIMLFCIRCSNASETLHDDSLVFQLRISLEAWSRTKAIFIERGFIDEDNNLLNWSKRQYESDSSTARVRAHRERLKHIATLRNVSVTSPDTEADTEQNKQEPRARDDEKSEQPTAAGLACRAIMAQGIQANPSHPDLLAAIAEGTTTQEFSDAAAECKKKNKGFPYLLAMVRRRKAEAAAPVKPTEPRKREPFRAGEKKPRGDPSRLGEHLAEIGKRFGVGDDEGGTVGAMS